MSTSKRGRWIYIGGCFDKGVGKTIFSMEVHMVWSVLQVMNTECCGGYGAEGPDGVPWRNVSCVKTCSLCCAQVGAIFFLGFSRML